MFQPLGLHLKHVQQRLDHRGEDRLRKPAEPETCERDAELGGAERGIEILRDLLRDDRPSIAFLDERMQLCLADLHKGKLGRDEESVEQDEEDDEEAAPKEF